VLSLAFYVRGHEAATFYSLLTDLYLVNRVDKPKRAVDMQCDFGRVKACYWRWFWLAHVD